MNNHKSLHFGVAVALALASLLFALNFATGAEPTNNAAKAGATGSAKGATKPTVPDLTILEIMRAAVEPLQTGFGRSSSRTNSPIKNGFWSNRIRSLLPLRPL